MTFYVKFQNIEWSAELAKTLLCHQLWPLSETFAITTMTLLLIQASNNFRVINSVIILGAHISSKHFGITLFIKIHIASSKRKKKVSLYVIHTHTSIIASIIFINITSIWSHSKTYAIQRNVNIIQADINRHSNSWF